jgi:hypothetical protein
LQGAFIFKLSHRKRRAAISARLRLVLVQKIFAKSFGFDCRISYPPSSGPVIANSGDGPGHGVEKLTVKPKKPLITSGFAVQINC